jgi:hypothetical protein
VAGLADLSEDAPLELCPEVELRDLILVDVLDPRVSPRSRIVVRVVLEEPPTTTPPGRRFLTIVTRLDGALE